MLKTTTLISVRERPATAKPILYRRPCTATVLARTAAVTRLTLIIVKAPILYRRNRPPTSRGLHYEWQSIVPAGDAP